MEKLSPEKAKAILKKDGVEMKDEEVKIVLELLRKLSKILVENYLRDAKKLKLTATDTN